ncbi:MAG: YgjV family protein [Tenericutes bacterium]|nr:YgjV family protein [Mycoplasmatota bacterium]
MNILYAQLVGAAAMLTFSFSVQCRKKKHMMIVQMFAHFLFSIQYALLNAFAASYMDLVAVIRSLLFYKYDKSRKKVPIKLIIPVLFCTLVIGYFNYTDILSLIPLVTALSYTIGASFKDPKVYKKVFSVCAALWFIYNLTVGAYVCVIGNLVEIASAIIAIKRDKKSKRKY